MKRPEAPATILLICCLATVSLPLAEGQAQLEKKLLPARLSEVIDGDTVRVWLDQKQETLRYESIEAAELTATGGYEARQTHERILAKNDIWLELAHDESGKVAREGHGRLIGYVFLDPDGRKCVNAELVRQGAARIGIRAVGDETPPEAFPLKYLDELLKAQIEAVRERRGWWGIGDPYAQSDFVICFVKFWGKDEVAWLLNRGKSPINLAARWKLSDETQYKPLFLNQAVSKDLCELLPGGVCRIHSGSDTRSADLKCSTLEVDLLWRRQRVWNNTGDRATLTDEAGKPVYGYDYKATGS